VRRWAAVTAVFVTAFLAGMAALSASPAAGDAIVDVADVAPLADAAGQVEQPVDRPVGQPQALDGATGHVDTGKAIDDYPYRRARPNLRDRWSFSTRQCTSFVAWRLVRDRIPFHNRYRGRTWGNATNWDEAARAAHVRVDGRPTPGSVAQFDRGVRGAGRYGHVAYVLRASGGKVLVEDYNWNPYGYKRHWVVASGLHFLHFTR